MTSVPATAVELQSILILLLAAIVAVPLAQRLRTLDALRRGVAA